MWALLRSLSLTRGRWTLGVLLVLSAVLGAGYLKLAWTHDPEVVTLDGSEELRFYRSFVERWGSDELIVLGYEVDDAFAPDELSRLRDLTEALLDLEGVRWVSSLDTAFSIDTGPFGPYARPLVPDDISEAGSLREEALSSPFVRDALVSSDGSMLLIAVQLEGTELDNSELERRVLEQIDAVLARPEFAGIDVLQAGSPIFNRALATLNQRDNALFTPLAVVIVGISLMILFRRPLPALLALAALALTVLWTQGLMGWLGVPMNITTSLLPPLLMVIGVADAVHIIDAYLQRLSRGDTRAAAIEWTLREIGPSCIWTTTTTAIGFASLLLVRIESVRVFGAFAIAGVWIALVQALLLLPALLVRLPLERATRPLQVRGSLRQLDRLAARPIWAMLVLGIAVLGGALGLPRLEVATHDGEFFREDHPINRAYRVLETQLQGVTPFEIEVAPSDADAAQSAEGLRAVAALQDGLARFPELTRGTSLVDLLEFSSPGLDLRDADATQRALFLLRTLAPAELERFLHTDPPRLRISARADAMTSARSEDLLAAVEDLETEALPPGWTARATGLVPVFAQMEQYLVEDQLRSYGVAIVAIGLAFAVLLRSLRLALLALAANVVPVGVAVAVMGFSGIHLDVVTIMVASVALGIIVDDTIHLTKAFRRGLDLGRDSEAAVTRALEVAGRPVLVTSVILVLGFGVLTLSEFQPTAHFGLLVSVSVASALLADLVVLPAGLRRLASPAAAAVTAPADAT